MVVKKSRKAVGKPAVKETPVVVRDVKEIYSALSQAEYYMQTTHACSHSEYIQVIHELKLLAMAAYNQEVI